MNIQVAELNRRKGEPLPFRTTLDPGELTSRHGEIRSMSPVEVTGEAVLAGGLYDVQGEMTADVDFACGRCLKPFRQRVDIPFHETFAPADSDIVLDEESDIHPLDGDEIALTPLLQEDFLLAIPSFPVCDAACKGLCPTCGTNRNEQPCDCKNERIDPRLAGLADFFAKSDE